MRTLTPYSIFLILMTFMCLLLGAAIPLKKTLQAMYVLLGYGFFIIATTVLYSLPVFFAGAKDYLWLGIVLALLPIGASMLAWTSYRNLEVKFLLIKIGVALIGANLLLLASGAPSRRLKILALAALALFALLEYFLIKDAKSFAKISKEAEALAREREKLTQAKDQFLLSLQHHLRTPLGPIRGYLERILSGAYGREENPVIKEKLIEIKKMTDTLYSTVETLLQMQELKVGKRSLNLEFCDLAGLIAGVIEEMRPLAEEKGLYLKLENPKQKPPKAKIDKNLIRTVLWGLIDDGIKYTTHGGIMVKFEIQSSKAEPRDSKARWEMSAKHSMTFKIIIQDTGVGMEKEEIDYFLEGKLFERGSEAKKFYGPGRGIGLGTAIEIIKAHGGTINISSEGWGKGTTFLIELPI